MQDVNSEITLHALPVICTRGMVVFPGSDLTLDVGRQKSLKAIENGHLIHQDQVILVSQVNPVDEEIDYEKIYHVGTLCTIKKRIRRDSLGTIKLTVTGVDRVALKDLYDDQEALYTHYQVLMDEHGDESEEIALVRRLSEQIEATPLTPALPKHVMMALTQGVSAGQFADSIAQYLNTNIHTKQRMLEECNTNQRLLLLMASMEEEKNIQRIENEINRKVRESVDENQRDYYLREKLRAIKEELGESSNRDDDIDNLEELMEKHPYPKHVKDKVAEELRRYEMMPQASSESSVIRTYLDWLVKVPWYQETKDNDDIKKVEQVLDEDHYGLEKVKERIVEHLAVKQMTQSLKSPIICLVGPPGVGKTSLAKSIARALDREFVKASLGGVKDESEIRGHRRTYLGSMPGRIIQGMKKAGVINPVFLLDEIDKMSSDYRGDPSSAMLEVLDPEQNSQFSDNYLEEPYDLSKVLFIATANTLDTIPAPLQDRLEIIELSSYTEQEKLMIAKNHLIPKQLVIHGLTLEQLALSEEAIMCLIRHYTREAGVRQLERYIAKICRKAVLAILRDHQESVFVDEKDLEGYLGKKVFDHTKMLKEPHVGVVTGLAYTQFGGDILPIEVNHFEGSGKLVITGQLGDVMKESASIALDYIKANAKKYGIEKQAFEKQDIHIHVPEGAVKKDGPSAGVTLTTAICSAFLNKPVRHDIAMTGEVTLRGDVLPIGGLKEKSISAHRSGIHTIFIPKDNEKDIEDIPESVMKDMDIILVDHVDTVLEKVIIK